MAEAPKSSEDTPEAEADTVVVTPESPAQEAKADEVVLEEPAEDAAPSEDVKSEEPPASRQAPGKPAKKRVRIGGFVGLVTGGILAAVIGFAAARTIVPEGWPFPGVAPKEDPLVAVVADQGAALSGLTDRIASLENRLMTLENDNSLATLRADLSGQMTALGERLDSLDETLTGIDTRLATVEKQAPEGSAAAQTAAEAYARELASLREMFQAELDKVEAAQADATALQAAAAESAKAAAGRAAFARITAALDTGRPFDEPLADLIAATGIEAPPALASAAAKGVPTLATLQESFPEAARAALDTAIRAAVADGSMNRFTAFLRSQLGARSLEPKEGDDADAILSRAEEALRGGALETALSELDSLPEAAQAPLADWRAQAEERFAALQAGAQLANQLK